MNCNIEKQFPLHRDQVFRAVVEEQVLLNPQYACGSAGDFIRMYYDGFDTRRPLLSRHYLDDAVILRDGTGKIGKEAIGQYLNSLPSAEPRVGNIYTRHKICLCGTLVFFVTASGLLRYDSNYYERRTFRESFVIVRQGNEWKINSAWLCSERIVGNDRFDSKLLSPAFSNL